MIKKYSLVFVLLFNGFLFSYSQCSDLFISEYVEGSSFNKYIELYNPTNTDIVLDGIYSIDIYSNGSPTVSNMIDLTGTISAFSTFIIADGRAALGVATDLNSNLLNFNGNDAVALNRSGTLLDVIGQIGFDPGAEWFGSTCSQGTQNGTLIRNRSIQIGDSDGSDVFNLDTEWTCLSIDDTSDLGFHESSCFPSPEIQLQFPIGNNIACGYTHDYGIQNIGTSTDITFTIENVGNLDLDITDLSFTTGFNFALVNSPSIPLSIASGNTIDITIRFSPNALGVFNDELIISSSDASEASCSINLQGMGSSTCDTSTEIIAAQDFESATTDTWNFTANHAELINNWYVTNNLSNIASAQTNSNFWGITDLERQGHMNLTHELIFDAIDVSAFNNVELSFYYYTVDLDGSDSFEYEIFYDGVSQGLVDISINTEMWTNVTINIPDNINTVAITFSPDIDAVNDQAGIDNLVLSSTNLVTTTWDGITWNWSDSTSQGIPPSATSNVIINGSFSTENNGGSFSACSLTVNSGTFTVTDGNFIEITNDVIVNGGKIITETHGSFVQRGDGIDAGVFTVNSGTTQVSKITSSLSNWYDYTYFSSPVENENTDNVLFSSTLIFSFNANNFIDVNGDGIDDDANAWTDATNNVAMTPGQGFATTSNRDLFTPTTTGLNYTFNGPYNTGDITYPVINNTANYQSFHWNLIGNPYPSAIDTDLFFATNSAVVEEVAYLWSHLRPPSRDNIGNEVLNFNQSDYITISRMSVAGNGSDINEDGMFDDDDVPEEKIPSGQSFFIPSKLPDPILTSPPVTPVITTENVLFTNSMRVSGDNANDLFFRNSKSSVSKKNTSTREKLWLNLSSDIGIFSQISIVYSDVSTDEFDGSSIDTPRNYAGNAGILYSLIESEKDLPFVIQGKAASSLNIDEVVKVGFGAYISTEETYRIDLLKTEGEFLTSNPVYLKDNYLGVLHEISTSQYTFKSQGGTFNDRFEIVFKNNTLSTDDEVIQENGLAIIELNNGNVQFTIKNSNLTIDSVTIFDIQGRLVYDLDGNNSTEIYNLSNINASAYIAKVLLSNGQTITQKSIKK